MIYTIIICLIRLGINCTTFRLLLRIAFILSRSVIIITYPSNINIFRISYYESQCHNIMISGPLPRSPPHIYTSISSVSHSSFKSQSHLLIRYRFNRALTVLNIDTSINRITFSGPASSHLFFGLLTNN
jgi:hypothetical protein